MTGEPGAGAPVGESGTGPPAGESGTGPPAGEPADGPTAAPGPGAEDPVLELREVEAGYGPFRALFGVDLVVPPAG
ncbi:MAG TPA: hypothetical protein VJM49_14920, partial [Acidimicrobiales bacterium]|nr:hypothetical protein [Acidimicrobiales bacterium]